jgi:elongation factor G
VANTPDEHPRFPDPVISVIVEPKTKADEEKMAYALTALSKEDKTLRVRTDVETGKTIVSGMSELHLESIVDRMRREFHVAMDVGRPRVAYRETIRKTVTEEAKFIRRSGGRGQYAHCILKIEPQAMNKGFVFVDDVRPDRVPRQFIPSVEQGVREALEGGALAGFPIIGIKVTLIDGSSHEDDSSEMAFKISGAMALRSGCMKADPTILEPIMKLVVTAPEPYAGDVIGDLNSRRAKVSDMGDRGNLKFVECTVPLSAMFGYAAALRSLSQGRASFAMELSHYEEVPWDVYKASIDPHGPDEPPTASAGRPVRPIRPDPGLSGGESRPFPPESDK